MTPLVSVTMVVCNADQFLSEAIESVLAQTFRDFEFVIVDFGSDDKSLAIVSEYAAKDSRIALHRIPKCSLPQARDVACSYARGTYIAVMDADDVCLPHRLMSEIGYMEKHPDVAIVGSAAEWINAKSIPLGVQEVPCENEEIKNTLPYRCPFWHPTILLRAEAFRFVGGYRKAFLFAHDYDLELRLAEHFDCANLPEVLLRYRIHTSQVSFRKQALQTLCKLAAQASAEARKHGHSDPLNDVSEITPALLNKLGLGEARQQNVLVMDFRNWIRSMIAAEEYQPAFDAISAMLLSNLRLVEPWQVADMDITLALLYWRKSNFGKFVFAVIRAFLTHPPSIRGLFQRLGWAFEKNRKMSMQ